MSDIFPHFVVPAKSGKNHANVGARNRHARDIRLNVTEQRLWQDRNIVQIPGVLRIGVQRVGLQTGHTAAKENGQCVLNRDGEIIDYLPWVVECTSAAYSTSTVSFCD